MAVAELIDQYRAGPARVADAVWGLSREQVRSHPIAGTWSVLEVVCHLADSEGLFAERMKRVLAEDRPALLFFDPARVSTALAYAERDVDEEIACLEAARRQMARILESRPAEAWQRVGIHSREGEQTLEQLVRKAVNHLQHHLQFVIEKRTVLTLPPGSP